MSDQGIATLTRRPVEPFSLRRPAAAALCGVLLAGCTGSEPRAEEEAPLGWGGPVAAPEVRRWPRESLDETAHWSVAEAPHFVVVPDSVRTSRGEGRQRQIAGGAVFSDGRVVLLCYDDGGPESILLHVFNPASGEEAKIPAPKGEDGQPMGGGHTRMAVHGEEIVVVMGRKGIHGSEGSDVLFANREGEFTRPPAYAAIQGYLLGVFPDGSLVTSGKRTATSDTTLVSRVHSIRPVPAGMESPEAETRRVLFATVMAGDIVEPYKAPLPRLGAHIPSRAAGVSGGAIWIVPTERPELVAVDRSGDVLLRVEWEAGARPERFPAARRLLIGTNGLIHVQRMVWDDDRPRAGPEWLVFNQAGELAARLDIPRNLDVLAFGPASVVALHWDEAGVVEVRVHGLKKP